MRCILFIILLFAITSRADAQASKLTVHYIIDAKVDVQNKTINGNWTALVTNHTDSAISTIWIHLYPNAFSSEKTQYGGELLKWGKTNFYFAKTSEYGNIDSLQFSADNNTIMTLQVTDELVALKLAQPLQSADSVSLNTTFFTQLPFDFYDNGYKGNVFHVKTWIPLVALLDQDGWHTNAYSLFQNNDAAMGNFVVHLFVPQGYNTMTNGKQIEETLFQLNNSDRFIWQSSPKGTTTDDFGKWSAKSISLPTIAKHIYPNVFYSGRSPKDTIGWLGQTYAAFHRPVPFTSDSLFYEKNIDSSVSKSCKLGFLYDFRHTDANKYIFLSPAVGFNNYDKVMAGLLIHNYQLPRQPFSFGFAPMYAFGSKSLAGGGHLEYNIWKPRYHWTFGVSGLTYSRRNFDIADYPTFCQRMVRIVPSVGLTLFNKDINSQQKWQFGVRSFILKEQNYAQKIQGSDISFVNVDYNSTLFQYRAAVTDDRRLYPYSADMTIDQGKDFLRIGLTGKYFFNYDATNKGVAARLFAGKFYYLKPQTAYLQSSNSRYALSLSGPSGINDYTYRDYFIGRNESTGWMRQQIMERDGFFKVSTLNLNSFGLSDNWLASLNLTADLPDNLNPLNVLPFKVPLKLFFDLGTYAALWGDNPPAGNFLYDAGIQIPICHSLVNVYVPLLYSRVFRTEYRQNYSKNYFWRTISFNINLDILKTRSRLIY